MRVGGTLSFLISDHLGSTSLSTDANGTVTSEQRYTAWGEVRFSSSDLPTQYTYTGQYSYTTDFGLLFYNARWVDPALGRFSQTDSVLPGAENPQAYDRYAYVLNNPLRLSDPSGHVSCQGANWDDGPQCFRKSIDETLLQYGVTTSGMDLLHKGVVLEAVHTVGYKLSTLMGGSAETAFRQVYDHVNLAWGNSGAGPGCDPIGGGGCTSTAHQINFASMTGDNNHTPYRMVKNVVHELGHAYDLALGHRDGATGRWIRVSDSLPLDTKTIREQVLRPNLADNGELSPNHYDWQQHPPEMDEKGWSSIETFADMMIAWTYNAWNTSTDPQSMANVSIAETWMNHSVP